ncbi:MAG: MFS transporter [Gemmatimonadaceae bacterium]
MRRLIWLLALVSLVGYALRTNIAIAQEYMAPDLGLSMIQMGVISAWGFQLAYAVFQLPGGFLGDRYGAPLVLGLAVLGWSMASLASAMVGGGAAVAFATLFGARVLLGVSQAATYPVAAMATAQYIPAAQRVGASAVYLAAGSLGAALAPLTLAPLMVLAGWRAVFVASAVVGVLTAFAWFALAPRQSESVRTHRAVPISTQLREARQLLRTRPLLVLTASYFLHSAVYFVFVFWFFRYLTEARGFSVLASGVRASVPYFMAVVAAPLAGLAADRLSRRRPPMVVRRRMAMAGLTLAAGFVLIGANLPTPGTAILALGASLACLVSVEAPFWTTATALAPEAAGSAGGLLNLMGNLGGVFSIWLVPLMKDAWGWTPMFVVWSGVALVAAFLWLGVGAPDYRAASALAPSIPSTNQRTT